MSKAVKVLALIPARSGSKRVKNKNIKDLGGKPLIAYTIQAARKARLIDRIIVSTDSPKIAKVAKNYSVEVPFLRPVEISGENSTEMEYHLHALDWLKKNEGYEPDLIVNLYPTTPFRKATTIDRAIRKIIETSWADSLRSIRKCNEHPYKMWVYNNKTIVPFVKARDKGTHTLSYHLLPEVFIQNASIYITRPETIAKYNSTIGEKVIPFIMDEEESIDINQPIDFKFAEFILKR